MIRWRKKKGEEGKIKIFGLLAFLIIYVINGALSLLFLLSKILRIIPDTQTPDIHIPGLPQLTNDGIPLIVKIRAFVLLAFFCIMIANIVSHIFKIKHLNDKSKEVESSGDSNEDKDRFKKNIQSKKRVCYFAIFVRVFYLVLIPLDFLALLLKAEDVISNQHFYRVLTLATIVYALMPLAYIALLIIKEVLRFNYYDLIEKEENIFPVKAYIAISNFYYCDSIFSFVFDRMEKYEENTGRYFDADDIITCEKSKSDVKGNEVNYLKYSFLFLGFLPLEEKHENISMHYQNKTGDTASFLPP